MGSTLTQHATLIKADHLASLPEDVQDIIAGLLVAGSGVTLAYDDAANTLTISSSATSGVVSFNTRTGAVTLSKADVTGTGLAKADVGLGNVDNTSDVNKPVSTAQQSALNLKADLVGGFVPTAQIPAVAITDVFTVANQTAMLALTAQRGDMAIRTDTGHRFVLSTDSPGTLADWVDLGAATDAVASVNGQTGIVVLAKTDVGLANVDNTSDANKPVSTAQAAADAAAVAAAEAFAVQRANHTGTQAISTVTGLQTAIDGKMQVLARTAVKTANYTAVAGDLVPVDTTSAAVTVTLPNVPADKSTIAVKHIIQGGTNAVTVACAGSDVFNRTGGATTLTLSLLAQGVLLEYTASAAVWTIVADDIPLAQLDARFQPLDSDLTAIAALSTTPFGRSVLDRADAAALRTLAGLVIGTDVQAFDAELAALAGLTSAADKLPYFTGAGTASLTTLSAFIRTVLSAADGPTALATLGVKTVLKTTLETVNNSAVLQDDDQLFFAVAANETWLGMMTLFVDGGSTPDFQIAITAPAGATGIYSLYGLAASGANLAVQTGTTTTLGTALNSGASTTGAVVVVFFEVANGSTAGNVKLQWSQQVATATDTNVRPGSNLQARKV